MSKKLKCFFPTLLVLNAVVSIFKLIGVYARMELINCIAEGQSNKSIVHWIALVVSLIFSEYITLVIIQAAEIKIKKHTSSVQLKLSRTNVRTYHCR